MSVDERLREHRPDPVVTDVDAPLATVRHRVRRRRMVRRGVVAAVVLLALVAASAAALRPDHEPRVTAGLSDERLRVDLPDGYAVADDHVVRPESPDAGVDGDVEVLMLGPDRSLLIVSRPLPGGVPDARFPLDGPLVQGSPSQVREQANGDVRLWVPDLHGWELTIQGRGVTEADVRAVAELLVVRGSDVIHPPPGVTITLARHLDLPEDRSPLPWAPSTGWNDVPHPVSGASMTMRRIEHVRDGHHLVLDVVDGSGSTSATRWQQGGREVTGLGLGDALLLTVDGERRLGWTTGAHTMALRTDDPGISDDDLIAVARSVRFSP